MCYAYVGVYMSIWRCIAAAAIQQNQVVVGILKGARLNDVTDSLVSTSANHSHIQYLYHIWPNVSTVPRSVYRISLR